MGRRIIKGKIETGYAYRRLEAECFMQQVRNNYYWYSGDLGAVDLINELDITDTSYKGKFADLEYFIEKHTELKTRESQLRQFVLEKAEYLSDDHSELVYVVDKQTRLGYEITTFGGRKEININQLPELYMRYLEPEKKTYKLFKMTISTSNKRACEPEAKSESWGGWTYCEFSNLDEIEEYVKKDVIRYRTIYFAIKNDGSKAYMIGYKISRVNKTTKKSDDKQRVDVIHPVYYAAKVLC